MELEEGLYAFLTAQPAVTAIIGERIYPVFIPQEVTDPVMVYFRVQTQDEEPDLSDDPLTDANVQITIWGTSYAQCKAATRAIRLALTSQSRGAMGVGCQSVSRTDQVDVFEEDLKIPGVRAQYTFTFDDE